MIKYLWLIEDEELVRYHPDTGKMEKYVPSSGEWVSDKDLREIYTGEVRFNTLTEEEAWKKLKSLK